MTYFTASVLENSLELKNITKYHTIRYPHAV